MRTLPFAIAIAIIGYSQLVCEAATTPQNDRYAPVLSGIPETIGGYSVLAVLTSDNFACMRSGEKRLILQSPELTIDDAIHNFSKERITQHLQALNLVEYTQSRWEVVGPGIPREALLSQLAQSDRFFKANGCLKNESPKTTSSVGRLAADRCIKVGSPQSGEQKCKPPYQGYAIIQDVDAGNYFDAHAQSVYLVAPAVGNNQSLCSVINKNCYSNVLNNVLTDKNYFLQVGLYFYGTLRGGKGLVVWTDTSQNLEKRNFSIEYKAKHTYWTTITFTSGIWWMCAVDTANTATYSCQPATQPNIGTHLKKDPNTSIFAENFNKNGDWYKGFNPIEWTAYGAEIYRDSVASPLKWLQQATLTADACKKNWLPKDAILGSLLNRGNARFKTSGLPIYCE